MVLVNNFRYSTIVLALNILYILLVARPINAVPNIIVLFVAARPFNITLSSFEGGTLQL